MMIVAMRAVMVMTKRMGKRMGDSTLLLLLYKQLQSLSRDGLRNPASQLKNGEDNNGVVEDCDKLDRDDPSCFSCLGRVWVRMGLGTPRRSTP